MKLLQDLAESKSIVFFTGAGVSTPSGLHDFRGPQGLESQGIDLEKTLNKEYLKSNPKEFWENWINYLHVGEEIKPNVIHETISLLATMRDVTVVTQNIDGLHERAGNAEVIAIHGNNEISCTECGQSTTSYPEHQASFCKGGITRPNAILYGELLDENTALRAINAITNADMLIIAGTSLKVFPASTLVNYYRGDGKAYYLNNQLPERNHYGEVSFDGVRIGLNTIIGDLEDFFTQIKKLLEQAERKAHG